MDINLYLEFQEPIPFGSLKIHQPSIIEILRYGTEKYSTLLYPYIISFDTVCIEDTEENKEKIKIFDIICSDKEVINILVNSLKYFCKTENVKFKQTVIDGIYLVNEMSVDSFIINRNNFDELADIILQINTRERYKAEKPPVFANERQKDIWEKLQAGRARNRKRKEVLLEDIVNYCEFGGDYHISTREIGTWTLWKLMNCYKSIIGRSSYKDSFSIYLVNGDIKPLQDKHWTDLLKLKYKSSED